MGEKEREKGEEGVREMGRVERVSGRKRGVKRERE